MRASASTSYEGPTSRRGAGISSGGWTIACDRSRGVGKNAAKMFPMADSVMYVFERDAEAAGRGEAPPEAGRAAQEPPGRRGWGACESGVLEEELVLRGREAAQALLDHVQLVDLALAGEGGLTCRGDTGEI